jgi:cytochrome c oxidase subunit 1
MSDRLGRIHFAGTLVCMNLIFMPMFVQGLAGMNRRLYDGGLQYALNQEVVPFHGLISGAAWAMALFQIPFVVNFFWSIRHGIAAGDNPWDATTLEWASSSPPGHGNFARPPAVYRGPYEYSVPGARRDFSPQFDPEAA